MKKIRIKLKVRWEKEKKGGSVEMLYACSNPIRAQTEVL